MQNLVRSKTIGVTGNGGRGTAGAGPGRDLLLKTPPIVGALSPKIVEMGPRGHLGGEVSSKICMQVIGATSGEIW